MKRSESKKYKKEVRLLVIDGAYLLEAGEPKCFPNKKAVYSYLEATGVNVVKNRNVFKDNGHVYHIMFDWI